MIPRSDQGLAFLQEAEMGVGAWAWGDRTFWNYGRGYDDGDIEQAFLASLQAGINLVDTAEIYGNGRSETLLGAMIQKTDQPVLVATKFFPFPWRFSRRSMVKALQGSLKRLGLQQVDLYQVHWPPFLVSIEELAEGLALVLQAGMSRTVGVSNFTQHQMQRAITVLSKYGFPLASNQVEYHLLNRRVEKNGLLARCHELDVRLIAYSPLAKGLLTGKYGPEDPPNPMRGNTSRAYLQQLQGLISLMREIGSGHGGKTPAQVALNWTICKGALPIPGAKNLKQAGENVGAIGWRLTEPEVQALDQASDPFTR